MFVGIDIRLNDRERPSTLRREGKEIQIGYETFASLLIKWKHKKRMHFEIETVEKELAHLIR
jgi:hypothetical protein